MGRSQSVFSNKLCALAICNIGNNNPVGLKDYIKAFETTLRKEAKKELLPLQPGDVPGTLAGGVGRSVEGFKSYYY